MAIDPTTPLTPIVPAHPPGTAADSVATLQALARAALANTAAQLGEIVGRPGAAVPKAQGAVEQSGQTSGQDAGHLADASVAKGGAPAAPQAPNIRLPQETRMVRAVRGAAAEAVPRQAGLAPLMAEVRAVMNRPDMPVEVREAGRALLARAPTTAEIVTPQGLRRAVERSGVFLEARMARAAATPAPEGAARPAAPNDLKAALLVFRGALSTWLAKAAPRTLVEEIGREATPDATPPQEDDGPAPRAVSAPPATAPVRTADPAMPRPAPPDVSQEATEAPPAAIMPDEVVQDGPEPRASSPTAPKPSTSPISQSLVPPLTAEAPESELPSASVQAVAEAQPDEPAPPPVRSQPSLIPTQEEAIAARFGGLVATQKAAAPPPPSARAALSALVQLGLMAEDAVHEEPQAGAALEPRALVARGYGAAASAEAAGSKVPPPPYAGGPMAGQKPGPPEIPGDMGPIDMVRRLLKGATGALARQDLMQIASLPETHHPDAETIEARPQGQRLNLDLPFVTPQGVAVAQFEISRDGGGSAGGAVGPAERTYKARFSIDVEPLGPVHALVTLTGSRTRVSLWAERADTIARLRAGEESLGAALRQAELTPEVAVHSGAPPTPGVSPLGHFVDQAS